MLSDWLSRLKTRPDHLVVDQGRAAAVAGIDRGVDLDSQARGVVAVRGELDPRDDPLGDRQLDPALGIAVDQHGFLDLRAGRAVRGRGGRLVEERLVLQLQDRQVDARADRFDRRGQLVARLRTTGRRPGWRR